MKYNIIIMKDILMMIREKTYQINTVDLFKSLNKFKIEHKNFDIRL